jgi:hypothetical protein
MSTLRRAGTALVSAALAVTLTSTNAQAATVSPAGQSGDWLAGQLRNGVMHNNQFNFDDYGLTIDTAFALQAIGGHRAEVRQIRHVLSQHVNDYTTFGSDVSASATAKLLVAAQDTGASPRHFGGVNLIRRLSGMVSTTAPTNGRIEDKTTSTDFANTIGQIFAVRGLLRAKNPMSGPALRFLLEQQCAKGYFRLDFSKKAATNQGCRAANPADNDVTSLAVVELWKQRAHRGRLAIALKAATRWLQHHQQKTGSFGGGPSTSAPNSNSTGLAGWALGLTGHCSAAGKAAGWIDTLQVTGPLKGTPLAGERGAIAYDHAALKAGRHDGITKQTRDQWRRATTQAAPALRFLGGRHCQG